MWYIRLTNIEESQDPGFLIKRYAEISGISGLSWEVWPDGNIYIRVLDLWRWNPGDGVIPEVYSKDLLLSGISLKKFMGSSMISFWENGKCILGIDQETKTIIVFAGTGNNKDYLLRLCKDLAKGLQERYTATVVNKRP